MVCLYCRKPIGLLRRIKDPNFCCDGHRQKLVSRSARALRDVEDLYGPDAHWKLLDPPKNAKPGYATTVFAVLGVTFLLLAISDLPLGSSPAPVVAVSTSPHGKGQNDLGGGGLGSLLGTLVRSGTYSTAREDFRGGLSDWHGNGYSGSWARDHGYVRPTGGVRIWERSSALSNYEFEFMGQIEHKSLDWAFRATDPRNYYATKLTMGRPGPLPNAGLVRFIVLDGRERERVELPLPLTLEPGVDYRVRVSVRGSRFLTSVNGQLVSSWTDARLSKGGVGFFSEDGEAALLKWVSVSERDSFVGRIVSHFSLFTLPTATLPQ
ncbi:MAG TPA: hypothetical protein VKG25_24025 [Bryobacteraceae bacterium]|nr:hypothetical protein [Bryobacteraceae bacterium]